MKNIFTKIVLAVSAAALVFAAFPVTSAFAADDTPTVPNDKLEKVWARQLQAYEKIGKGFQDTDTKLATFQQRIDKASANGKDVTALQAALDAYSSALTAAQPIYASMESIVTAHAGFDADGKVTDAEQAKATVEQMRSRMQELKSTMNGTFKALREALKAFREANKPAEPKSDRDS